MENKTNEMDFSKLGYEDLKTLASQAVQQAKMMSEQLKQHQFNEAVARLQFLFKVLEFSKFFPENYLSKSVIEIQNILAMPEDTTEEVASNELRPELPKVKVNKK